MNEEFDPQNTTQGKSSPRKSRIGYLFGIIMLVIYLTMAYMLAFTPYFENSLENPAVRYTFAAIFAAYAILRGYRFIKG